MWRKKSASSVFNWLVAKVGQNFESQLKQLLWLKLAKNRMSGFGFLFNFAEDQDAKADSSSIRTESIYGGTEMPRVWLKCLE